MRAHEQLAEQERPERDALADRADDDVAGGLHEDDLEQHQRVGAGVVGRAAQEEALAAEEPPLAAADQELVERRRAAEVAAGAALIGDAAQLEREADGVVGEEGEDVGGEVQHHQMRGVLLAHQAAGEQREAGLHEEHEVAGVQRPASVGGDADVADGVGQLDRQRLLRRLRLVLVEGLLLLGVVGRPSCRSARRRRRHCRPRRRRWSGRRWRCRPDRASALRPRKLLGAVPPARRPRAAGSLR